ncbi:MAG: alpha/beta fold hydrolase [Deltaproteobacteria bacterium]|nr:alpha/beta fold hydrolase [Deltaproteobacteria bacterium]
MTPPRRPPQNRTLRQAARTLRKGADRAVSRFVNGVDWWMRDPSQIVDRTPYTEVLHDLKLVVRRYLPLETTEEWELGTETLRVERRRYRTPVLLIPPLMVRPLIFDLVPDRSYVRTLLKEGYDVFLVDFGEPDKADECVTLNHYVLDWLPMAVDAVCRASRSDDLSLIGYCMGGLFALMHTSVNEDPRVRNIVTIASPVDAHKMGIFAWVVRMGGDQLEFLSKRMGNLPGELSSRAFKMVKPLKNVTRYAELFLNLWNEEYVNGFDALNQWTEHFLDYPGSAFRQFLNDFVKENKLKDGRMVFGDKVADLTRITCPLLAFVGADDVIVPPSAATEIVNLVSSTDKDLRLVPGGHMGVFAGRHAPEKVWRESARWLARRSAE